MDGSVFPTSIGANPQLSIYGLTWRNAARLTGEMRRGDTVAIVSFVVDSDPLIV